MLRKKGIVAFLVAISIFSFGKAHAQEDKKQNILVKTPFFHQYNDLSESNKEYAQKTACGPTAVAIMLQNEGIKVDPNDLLAILPTSIYQPRVGFYKMQDFAAYFEKEVQMVEFSHKNIYEALDRGKTLFINIKNYDSGYGHAMVIVGMKGLDGEKAESLIAHDVFVGPYREFKFLSNTTLRQPEGQTNYINTSMLFYIK
jgi:hypothetical protein